MLHSHVETATPEQLQAFKTGGVKPFPFTSSADLLRGPKSASWLLRGLVPSGALALLFGESTAGKSFVALDWAACIATGTPWHHHRVEQGSVFYVAGEGLAGIGKRLAAWEVYHRQKLTDAPLFVSARGASLLDEGEAIAISLAIEALAAQHGKPALVVIDTLHRNMGGDENSSEDVARFIANLDRHIREPLGCAVLLVHHAGHADKGRLRGSSAIRAALDCEFLLAIDGNLRRLDSTKQKDAEPLPSMFMEARTVELPEPWVDDEGESLTSLVMVKSDGGASRTAYAMPQGTNQTIVWRELGAFFKLSKDFGQGGAPASRPCLQFDEAITAVKGKLPCESDRQHERTKTAIRGLIGSGLLVFGEGWIWCK